MEVENRALTRKVKTMNEELEHLRRACEDHVLMEVKYHSMKLSVQEAEAQVSELRLQTCCSHCKKMITDVAVVTCKNNHPVHLECARQMVREDHPPLKCFCGTKRMIHKDCENDLLFFKKIRFTPLDAIHKTIKEKRGQESDCVICYSNPKNVVIYPCKHVFGCEGCINKLLENAVQTGGGTHNFKCAVCRCVVARVEKIFFS